MTYTENYNLALPAGTDPASITPLNRNATMIDGYLKDLQDQIDEGGGGIDIDVIGEGSGSLVTFADGSGLPLKSMTVDIEAVQSGSGTPSPENVRPIIGWDEMVVRAEGKNLLNYNDFENIAIDNSGTETISTQRLAGGIINVVRNLTYTISALPSGIMFMGWAAYNNNRTFTNRILIDAVNTTQFTPTTKYIRLLFRKLDSANISKSEINGIQLELGSTATSYEPYNGHTYTITLDGTRYGGQLDVTNGTLTVTHANIPSYNGETINEPWISSMDEYASGTTPTTGAQVVYPLTTPQTYQLTPQQIQTLIGTNNISADGLNIDLEYIKGGDFTDAVKAIIDVTIGSSNAILSEVIGE